jgi:hypothetical protein
MPQSITQPFDDLQIRAHSTICAEFVLRGNGIQLRNRLSESTYHYLNQTGDPNEKLLRFDFVRRGDGALDSDTVA